MSGRRLKSLELSGFKSFAKKTVFLFDSPVSAIVGPNGSGKSNCAEAFRWVLGERSMKSLRGARGEDLIFNGANSAAKQNRAAVTLIFDNHDRKFNLDFDEVAIGREVHRDGTNVYTINGSTVRARDVVELLAAVSLGSSDHYIVNQGDADRVLLANPRERRGMIEDALGLRLYQWKIEESEKKLVKTEENMRQVESLRRELAPHLKYLKKQVDKITEADNLRRELKTLYLEYLKREDAYLAHTDQALQAARREPEAKLREIDQRLRALGQAPGLDQGGQAALVERVRQADEQIRQALRQKEELGRRLGRLEGLLEAKQAALTARANQAEREFSYQEVEQFSCQLTAELSAAEAATDLEMVKRVLGRLKDLVQTFWHHGQTSSDQAAEQAELRQLSTEIGGLNQALEQALDTEARARQEREAATATLQAAVATAQATDKERLQLRALHSEWQSRLNSVLVDWDQWKAAQDNFRREVEEAVVLVDQEMRRYQELALPGLEVPEERSGQEERRRRLERLKIKLEELGVETGDTLKEYQETSERDAFLAKELTDLEQSAVALHQVIKDLRDKINTDFESGLRRINDKFQEFFALMFGGGTAKLTLLKEVLPSEPTDLADDAAANADGLVSRGDGVGDMATGIAISVNLPRKKIRGLEMLSGGERALTSIALLFAMSQVNPPPFLILDETDAALDEANSRKYGEMVANLAVHSQLILITHNRETMSRAGVLYGVTMGSDGISKLLSIKFDEAAAYAK